MLIEKPYATSYLLAIAISITVYEIFTVEMCIILTLTFTMVQGQM